MSFKQAAAIGTAQAAALIQLGALRLLQALAQVGATFDLRRCLYPECKP